MAITNNEHVGLTLDLLEAALQPFIERELRAVRKDNWIKAAMLAAPAWQTTKTRVEFDVQALLTIHWDNWNDVFQEDPVQQSGRFLVSCATSATVMHIRRLSQAMIPIAHSTARSGC